MRILSNIKSYFYSGLSGLILPIPKYLFPAPFENASRLTYYASHFNSIEINSSFYKIPQGATVSKWASSVPEDFKFTFKLWREITHIPGLNFNKADVARFFQSINNVQEKKGCLLVQFPPGLKIESISQLKKLLICLKEYNSSGWKIAVEFRNKSWHDDSIYQLLNDFKACLVIQDKLATPSISHEQDFIYIRFHGPTGNYMESYSDDFLSEYATYIHEWISEGKEVYVYFNNTMGDAFGNLKALNALVRD
ncbi:MAG: DUF72 domain-containing protein [Saprospiraceae bacterium]|nr:DUF72 domain-containing protein [Saprospiraceae bacterium]